MNWFNFFITPFVTGHQSFLFLAAWFVPQLFIVHLLAQWLLVKDPRHYFSFLLLIISLVISFFISFRFKTLPADWLLVTSRTVLALSFYLLGHAFNVLETKLRPILIYPFSFAALYIIYVSLESFFGGFTYFFAFLQFINGPVVTILGTLCAILMIYVVSYYLAQSLPEKNFLYQIGGHTFSIMALHLLIFWLINYFLYRLAYVPRDILSNIFYQYHPEKFWFIYVSLGVALPVLMATGYNKLKVKYQPKLKWL